MFPISWRKFGSLPPFEVSALSSGQVFIATCWSVKKELGHPAERDLTLKQDAKAAFVLDWAGHLGDQVGWGW